MRRTALVSVRGVFTLLPHRLERVSFLKQLGQLLIRIFDVDNPCNLPTARPDAVRPSLLRREFHRLQTRLFCRARFLSDDAVSRRVVFLLPAFVASARFSERFLFANFFLALPSS